MANNKKEMAKNNYCFESRFKVGDTLKYKGREYEVTSITFEYFKDDDIRIILSVISLEGNHINKIYEKDEDIEIEL